MKEELSSKIDTTKLDDKTFMGLAIKQGMVFSLKEFEDAMNSNILLFGNTVRVVNPVILKYDKLFTVISVSRKDLDSEGFDTDDISDDQMQNLARLIQAAAINGRFWRDLRDSAHTLGIEVI